MYRGDVVVRNDKQYGEQVTDAMVLSIYAVRSLLEQPDDAHV